MSHKSNILIIIAVLALLVLGSSLYVVNERQVAVITQFQRLISTEDKAGLKFKVPPCQVSLANLNAILSR